MWTLLIVFAKMHVITATPIEFYSKAACLDAQPKIEAKFNVETICVYQGE
jgi:hypothetical protein